MHNYLLHQFKTEQLVSLVLSFNLQIQQLYSCSGAVYWQY